MGLAEFSLDWASPRYVLMDDGTVRIIMQTVGGGQGWVHFALFWCITQLPTLRRMARAGCRGPERNVVGADIDDANLAGSHDAMVASLHVAKAEYPKLGLSLNLAKTKVVCPDLNYVSADVMTDWQAEGLEVQASAKLLGGCLTADNEQLLEFLAARIDPYRPNGFHNALRRLGHPDMDPQSALLVATIGVQHALDYYMRIFPPSIVRPLYAKFDAALLLVMVTKLGLNELRPNRCLPEWDRRMALVTLQLQLPVRYAGLGLRPSATVCLAASLASLAACADEILDVTERMHHRFAGDGNDPSRGSRPDDSPDDAARTLWLPERYRTEYDYCRSELLKIAPSLHDLTFATKNDPDGANQLK